jgi:hypothetical protein
MGHYIWVIKCKRWEYSSEPGVLAEPQNVQINDSEEYGRMEGSTNPSELIIPYPDSVDGTQKCIFDHDATNISKDYGYYGGYEGIPMFNTINSETTVSPNVYDAQQIKDLEDNLEFIEKVKGDYPDIEKEIETPDDAPVDGGSF